MNYNEIFEGVVKDAPDSCVHCAYRKTLRKSEFVIIAIYNNMIRNADKSQYCEAHSVCRRHLGAFMTGISMVIGLGHVTVHVFPYQVKEEESK